MFNFRFILLLAVTLFEVSAVSTLGNGKVSPALERVLQVKGHANVVLSFSSTNYILNTIKLLKYGSRQEKLRSIATKLQNHAQASQKSVLEFLSTPQGDTLSFKSFQSYWINNKIFVKNANMKLVQLLAQYSEVLGIREEISGNKVDPFLPTPSSARSDHRIEWGLEKINVQEAWNRGINGSGVIVGILDSGVRWTHESLRDSYVGDYGWFAPIRRTKLPEDESGHGTHCLGTIVGQGGIGVAPGSKWMACQNIPGSEGEDIACGQFMLCPHLPDGSNPDCSRAPDLVSNSWGYPFPGDAFFDEVLAAWDTAGIVPIFAAGNEGPRCRSLRSPGDSKNPAVIAVGATDSADQVARFSSSGPSYFGQVKPDIAAPGLNINSADASTDHTYTLMSGTSMAAPHVAGVVALIRSAHPNSSIPDVVKRVYDTAKESISSTGQNCGDVPESNYPNNHVGHGFLSATASI